jgi:hypothetical protein
MSDIGMIEQRASAKRKEFCSHKPIKRYDFTGKSAGCPAFLPVGRGGEEADPVIISTLPGSPALWAGSFT